MLTQIKSRVKELVPERYRLLRYELFEKLRYYPELIVSWGTRLECPFCGGHFRRFRPAGFDYPILKEKQVVGASYHLDDVCPRCFSNARERLAYLFLKTQTILFTYDQTVLHIAPEPNIARLLKAQPTLKYVTADLFEPDVMTRLDVMKLPFADSTFDAIICNHVLEHVPDDRLAMFELQRILKPGGWALLQVPIALALDKTIEDPSAKTNADRIRLFGQDDHVRLYNRADYVERLTGAGFRVVVSDYAHELSQEDLQKYALIADEQIFIGVKE
ncbi:MAG TPA: class I SAM-dependent methyltransferase [Pyrinomonadaceae bacterium]|nr:class I SAM-dependent methyltransferase [Pyrinomonadaceae bacterium]